MGSCVSKGGKDGEHLSAFRSQCLQAHNEKRSQHGAAPLKFNAALNTMAQKWAETIAKKKSLQHSEKEARQSQHGFEYIGENLATRMFSSSDQSAVDSHMITGAMTVDQWYAEQEKFDWQHGGMQPGTGHFTQVVWKDSRELGVGMVRIQTGNEVNYYVCCNYGPGGNYGDDDDYKRNVQKGH